MFVLKLRKIGTAQGIILPKKMLKHLGAREGQAVFAVETPKGYALTTLDMAKRKQVEAGEAFMDRYHEVFEGLAKRDG